MLARQSHPIPMLTGVYIITHPQPALKQVHLSGHPKSPYHLRSPLQVLRCQRLEWVTKTPQARDPHPPHCLLKHICLNSYPIYVYGRSPSPITKIALSCPFLVAASSVLCPFDPFHLHKYAQMSFFPPLLPYGFAHHLIYLSNSELNLHNVYRSLYFLFIQVLII